MGFTHMLSLYWLSSSAAPPSFPWLYLCLNSSTQGISPSTFLSNVLHNPFHLSPLMHLFLLVGSFFAFQGIYIYSLPNNMHVPKLKATNWILHLHRTLLSKVRCYIPPSLRPIVLFALKELILKDNIYWALRTRYFTISLKCIFLFNFQV